MENLFALLASQEFLEKILLLLMAAALTGFLVPVVKAKMERTTFERQKIFEAQLARQADVIKAQTKFLTDFSEYIWEYHKISQRVSYCRLLGEQEAYQEALKDYQESLWDCLQKIRSIIGGARWFVSDAAHQALTSWYDDWFLKLEIALRELIATNPDDDKWEMHHTMVHYEGQKQNYELMYELAKEFGLRSVVDGSEIPTTGST